MGGHVTRVEIGIAMECLHDPMVNVTGGHPWRQADPVCDSTHAADVTFTIGSWRHSIAMPISTRVT